MRILIVDDEPYIRSTLKTALESLGHTVRDVETGARALVLLDRESFDVALLDLRLKDESGLDLMGSMLEVAPRLAVVIITAYASIDTAVEAMRRGACDYLPKPFTPDQIRAVLERASRWRELRDRVANLTEQVQAEVPEVELDTEDPQMRRLLDLVQKVAPTDTTVLLRGESGTGKGLLARELHRQSRRAERPFVTVSCPSLNPQLLESDLFGHSRGAFTDAVRDVAGKVAAAEGGTLFLDEVGDMPLSLQPKLLRFLQEKKYERVGETRTRSADVRLIAATSRDLEEAIHQGSFREDLLYRLNVVELSLPPLRNRTDLLGLAERLLRFFTRQTGRRLTGFTAEARDALQRYQWPGNVRELRNAIERAAILGSGPQVELTDLPERVYYAQENRAHPVEVGQLVSLERLEVEHMRRILAAAASREEAARILGIDPSTLYRKRKLYGI
jgi:NtrC-family two-component system response regulator AlgB